MHDKVQSFADGKYDLNRKDVEEIYLEQRGDASEQIEELAITKRIASTGQLYRPLYGSSLTFHQLNSSQLIVRAQAQPACLELARSLPVLHRD
jgi:hypothetical protein